MKESLGFMTLILKVLNSKQAVEDWFVWKRFKSHWQHCL